jgi:hypothetical protein
MALGGPMFEPADSGAFRSVHRKSGAHYNTYEFSSMAALRDFFPTGTANTMNFVLFSTSGVHGTYTTIEEIEASLTKYGTMAPKDEDEWPDDYLDENLPDDQWNAKVDREIAAIEAQRRK